MLNVFHVYVVVDDPVVCKSLQRLLEMGNFRCHCFPSVTKLTEQMSGMDASSWMTPTLPWMA